MAAAERDIQKAILRWLASRADIVHVRVPLGPVVGRSAGGHAHRKPNPMKGWPDIQGIVPGGKGRLFTIEVKDKTGKLRPEQLEWRERLVGAGVLYIVARSLEDAVLAMASGQSILE